MGFRRVDPRVLCWARTNAEHYPLPDERVTVVPYPEEPNDGGFRYLHRARNIGTRNFYGSVGQERRWIMDQAGGQPPEAILCHFGHIALRLLPVAEALMVPLVAHFHGLDLSSGLRNKWYRWSLLGHIRRFSDVVVVGSHQKKWMLDHGMPRHRVHLIPCGVPTSDFQPAINVPRRGIRFITVSRLTEFKGVDYSIRAFAILLQRAPDATLTIIGDGPEFSRLSDLVTTLGLADRVIMAGSLPQSAVRRHLQDSDVFLQHSLVGRNGWVEGFGVSIAEAAACGLPVVVTECGGIIDQVVDGQTGFVIAQRDVSAMAAAMVRLSEDRELRIRLGAAARERMESRFDTPGQTEKLERVLMTAMRRHDNGN